MTSDCLWAAGLKVMTLSPAVGLPYVPEWKLADYWAATERLHIDIQASLFQTCLGCRWKWAPGVWNHVLCSTLHHQEGTSGQNLVGSSLGQEAHQGPCVWMQPGGNGQRHHVPAGSETHSNLLFSAVLSRRRAKAVGNAFALLIDEYGFADVQSSARRRGADLLSENKVSPGRLQRRPGQN